MREYDHMKLECGTVIIVARNGNYPSDGWQEIAQLHGKQAQHSTINLVLRALREVEEKIEERRAQTRADEVAGYLPPTQ